MRSWGATVRCWGSDGDIGPPSGGVAARVEGGSEVEGGEVETTKSPPHRLGGHLAMGAARVFCVGAIRKTAGCEGRFWHPHAAREVLTERASEDR